MYVSSSGDTGNEQWEMELDSGEERDVSCGGDTGNKQCELELCSASVESQVETNSVHT